MIKTVQIEDKKIDSQKDVQITRGPSKGTSKTVWNCSIKIKGVWYRGSIWDKKQFQDLRVEGTFDFYHKEYKGQKYLNWKIPTQSELDTHRIESLENRVRVLEDYLREQNKTNV